MVSQEHVVRAYEEMKKETNKYKDVLKWVLISGAVFVALLIVVVLISMLARSPRRSFTPAGRF